MQAGRQQGRKKRAATPDKPRSKYHNPLIGTCYLHTVIDDHSRVAYVEAHDDETAATANEVLPNAVAWFSERAVTISRVLSDNGSCYRSNLWRETCTDRGIKPKRTRPYRPQTNGKIERFHRTLAEGWAIKKFYNSESARLAALPAWIHQSRYVGDLLPCHRGLGAAVTSSIGACPWRSHPVWSAPVVLAEAS